MDDIFAKHPLPWKQEDREYPGTDEPDPCVAILDANGKEVVSFWEGMHPMVHCRMLAQLLVEAANDRQESITGVLAGTWEHKKRGTRYRVVGTVGVQCERPDPLRDEERVLLYRNIEDGRMFVRRGSEFLDGRFTRTEYVPPVDEKQTELRHRLLNIMSEASGRPVAVLRDDAILETDLGLDSLDRVEITMMVEEEFNICVTDESTVKVKTVGDVIALVGELIGQTIKNGSIAEKV